MSTDHSWSSKLHPEVTARREELIELRRSFHKYPELSWHETETARRITAWLQSQGISNITPLAGTGVVALIQGGQPGPTIMYRADIDALPITEAPLVDYASVNAGVMHACGHDGHTAIALMLAALFQQRRGQLRGNLKVVFQPAEEGGSGGAKTLIAEGVMDAPQVDRVLGLHILAELPAGVLGVAPGATMAATDNFELKVIGKGGHAAYPHRVVDPIVTAAQLVSSLQTVVSRSVDPMKAAVVTVGTIHGGTQRNIVPDSVEMTGTIRGYDLAVMEQIPQRIETLARGITEAMGATFEFQHHPDNPPVINDADFTAQVQRHAAS
ncbi:MAG: M20 family metallopeptidase, partial [Dehalococcoidia bacterium]